MPVLSRGFPGRRVPRSSAIRAAATAQLRETRNKLSTAVQAAGTSLTGLFGVGPVIAAAVIGEVKDVSRFPDRDHFAACYDKKLAGGKTPKEALRAYPIRYVPFEILPGT
jgi:transposase